MYVYNDLQFTIDNNFTFGYIIDSLDFSTLTYRTGRAYYNKLFGIIVLYFNLDDYEGYHSCRLQINQIIGRINNFTRYWITSRCQFECNLIEFYGQNSDQYGFYINLYASATASFDNRNGIELSIFVF